MVIIHLSTTFWYPGKGLSLKDLSCGSKDHRLIMHHLRKILFHQL